MNTKNVRVTMKRAAVLVMALLMLPMSLVVRAAGGAFETAVSTVSCSLIKGESQLAAGDLVSTADTLTLRYDFSLTGDVYTAIKNAAGQGDSYAIDVPDNLRPKGESDPLGLDVMARIEGQPPLKFGTLIYGASGASLLFEGDFWSAGYNNLIDAYVEFACELDTTAVGDNETVNIGLYDGTTINVKVLENQKTDPVLAKQGEYDKAARRFNWTVSFTPGTKDAAYPLRVRDTLDTGHELVPGTVQYGSGSAILTAALPTDIANGTLTFGPIAEADLVGLGTGKFIFTYQTVLSDDALAAAGETTVTNTAQLFGDDDVQIGGDAVATANVPAKDKLFLAKTGTQSEDDSRVIDWTITLNTNDRKLKNLVLYDSFPDGLELVAGSVEIDGEDPWDIFALVTGPDTGDPSLYEFSIEFPAAGGYADVYTITYSTRVKDSYFDASHLSASFDNDVWLSFDWLKYDGTGNYALNHQTEPTVGKGTAVSNLLEKRGSYDRASHTITWTLTVNPHKVNVTEGTITDPLDIAGQEMSYVGSLADSSGLTVFPDDNKITLNTSGSTAQNLVLNVGNIGNTAYTVTFKTTVDDEDHFAYNTPTTDDKHPNAIEYENTAEFAGKVLASGGMTPQEVGSEAAAAVWVESRVLHKTAGTYDASTRELSWTITVNENKMPMADARVVDVLPAWLVYKSCTPDTAYDTASLGADGKTLTIDFGDINDTRTVTLVTTVDPDKLADFKNLVIVELSNTASLERTDYTGDATSTAKTTIANRMVKKKGGLHISKDYIEFDVAVNPNRLTLPAGLRLNDTMRAGLKVSAGSVKLYNATVNTDGSLTKGTEVTACDLKLDPATNSFSVKLPEGANAYVLEYICHVFITNGQLENNITIVGGGFSGAAGKHGCSVAVAGAGGGGSATMCGSATFTMVDRKDPDHTFLEGAVYNLMADYGNGYILVDQLTVGPDGKLVFNGIDLDIPHRLEPVDLVGYKNPTVDSTKLAGYSFTLDRNNRTLDKTVLHDVAPKRGANATTADNGTLADGSLPRTGQQMALPLGLALGGVALLALGFAGLRRRRRA